MKLPQITSFIAGCFLLPAALSAQTFLSLDFNAGVGAPSPSETGFSALNTGVGNTAGPLSQTYTGLGTVFTESGSVTLTVANGASLTGVNNLTARDRTALADTGTFTYGDLYRDILISSGSNTMSLGLSGLKANTAYEVRLFAYDNNNSRTITFTDFTSGSADDSGSVAYTSGFTFTSSTDNNVFSTLLSVMSNSSGEIVLRGVSSSGEAVINGLQLSASAIPEPSSYAMIFGALAMAGTVAARRRSRA